MNSGTTAGSEEVMVQDSILRFIARFTDNGKREQVAECFTQGCCYWFAWCLAERFRVWGPKLVYAESPGHFGAMILGRVYDITGDVTGTYPWTPWDELQEREPKVGSRIIHGCIEF